MIKNRSCHVLNEKEKNRIIFKKNQIENVDTIYPLGYIFIRKILRSIPFIFLKKIYPRGHKEKIGVGVFMNTISTEELARRLQNGEKLNIIDVREDFEVASGKIPGAIHIPLQELPFHKNRLDKNKEYFIVCQSGGRSARACEYLEQAGFKATNVNGGMNAWNGAIEF